MLKQIKEEIIVFDSTNRKLFSHKYRGSGIISDYIKYCEHYNIENFNYPEEFTKFLTLIERDLLSVSIQDMVNQTYRFDGKFISHKNLIHFSPWFENDLPIPYMKDNIKLFDLHNHVNDIYYNDYKTEQITKKTGLKRSKSCNNLFTPDTNLYFMHSNSYFSILNSKYKYLLNRTLNYDPIIIDYNHIFDYTKMFRIIFSYFTLWESKNVKDDIYIQYTITY